MKFKIKFKEPYRYMTTREIIKESRRAPEQWLKGKDIIKYIDALIILKRLEKKYKRRLICLECDKHEK